MNSWLIRDFDEVKNSFEACMQQYSRLSGKLEEIVRKCQNRVSDACRQQQQAQKQLNQARQEQQNARNAQDSNKQQAANAKVQAAQQAAAAAAREAEEAEKKLQEAQEKLRQLQRFGKKKGSSPRIRCAGRPRPWAIFAAHAITQSGILEPFHR